jgi:hypothetical protein
MSSGKMCCFPGAHGFYTQWPQLRSFVAALCFEAQRGRLSRRTACSTCFVAAHAVCDTSALDKVQFGRTVH